MGLGITPLQLQPEDDIGHAEYPTSAGLTFNHSFAHTCPALSARKFLLVTCRSDKAPSTLPYLCYLRAFGRCPPPSHLLLGLLFGSLALHLPPRGKPSFHHFTRRAYCGRERITISAFFSLPPFD